LKDKRIKEWPGPNSYKPPITEFDKAAVVKKTDKKGADRICAFISEAQYRSCQTPSPNHFRLNYVSTIKMVKKFFLDTH
jgi:hypothetical protein